MNTLSFIIVFCASLLYIFLCSVNEIIVNSAINLDFTEVQKCPFCYGTDLCNEFKNGEIKFKVRSFSEAFMNFFSVKNVYFATYKNRIVVLKKLAHVYELDAVDSFIYNNYAMIKLNKNILDISYPKWVFDLIENNVTHGNFHICNYKTANRFFKETKLDIDNYNSRLQVWYTIMINAEPLLLKILSGMSFPIPNYLGACGRVIMEDYSGRPLSDFFHADWHTRANLSLQLLKAAEAFTYKHEQFRFYLTDISSDNIVVDFSMALRFIDLENVIVIQHADLDPSNESVHQSENMEEDGFAFSPNDICSHTLSDHNYYAICKLLLSKNAPWPIINGGFLHSPPFNIQQQSPELFELIEACVQPHLGMDRFHAAHNIEDILRRVLQSEKQ